MSRHNYNRYRICPPFSLSSGTPSGAGGGGVASKLSRIHLPRFTGLVRVGLLVTARKVRRAHDGQQQPPVKKNGQRKVKQNRTHFTFACGLIVSTFPEFRTVE